ncbi:glycosyltransferase family 4 protein [Ornithinicoccus hortensis]|uniref:glycosyltransferase family 4 protein n=1 Tax=Ornithinicoccus hortensis TaxID=82346 RepID=UPI001B8871B1|nr:glycosyltransferase family 4 protein [Ornithinicoccus hortensis]
MGRSPGAAVPAAVRNLPTAASVWWRHVGRAGAKATSVALRSAPRPVRDAVQHPAVRGRRPDLAALALAAAGRTPEAVELLESALAGDGPAGVPPGVARRVASAATTLHLPDLASRALDLLPAQDRHRPRTAALVAAARGDLTTAVEQARLAPGIRGRQLATRLGGELEVLRHGILDDALAEPPPPRRATAPVRRVLHVVSNAVPEVQAGYTIRTHGIVTAQRDAGMDPHVVTRLGFPVDSGTLAARREVVVDGIDHHRLLPRGPMPLPGRAMQEQAVRELTALVERLRPDVLHAHSKHENAQVALVVGRRTGLPVVYEVRGFLEETWLSRGGDPAADFYTLSREAEAACMAAADRVVAISETMRTAIVGRGIPADRVSVVPNAVPAAFTEPLPDGAATRAELGFAPTDTVFGTVSTLNDYEGIDTLVAAVAELDDPAVRLLVVGDGPARSALQAQAAPLGDRVVFTGRVPHARVREHLAVLDVFCVSRRATAVTALVPPLKPLEAMGGGLPVLVSDLPPLVELVPPGRFGAAAPPGDPAAWAEEMRRLRYAPEHARTMGAQARDWVSRHGTWAAAADRYAEVYGEIARA